MGTQPNRNAPWSKSDEQWLIENYSRFIRVESAELLGRSIHAVQVKASELRRIGKPIGKAKLADNSNVEVRLLVDVPDEQCDAYWLEVTNSRGIVMGVYTLLSVEQIQVITTKYYGINYRYRLGLIKNGKLKIK